MRTGQFTGFEIELRKLGVLWIRFCAPDTLNAMTSSIKRDLIEVINQAQMDEDVRIVVFTGTGRAFCAGDDLRTYADVDTGQTKLVDNIPAGHDTAIGTYSGLRTISQALNTAIRNLDKLTICALNGIAIQTGFSLALSCDFRIASDVSQMGSATLRFGLLPDEGGQYLLVQAMGVAKTMDFLMRKKIIDAREALELGLIHEVVLADELDAHTMRFATELAQGPQVAMRLLKRSILNAGEMTWNQSLDEIAAKTAIADHHPDAREGVAAFKEKRQPAFNTLKS
ncbi:MAG: enoyl-CoA hydratase-related protein [Parasphingorhabdus sp.]